MNTSDFAERRAAGYLSAEDLPQEVAAVILNTLVHTASADVLGVALRALADRVELSELCAADAVARGDADSAAGHAESAAAEAAAYDAALSLARYWHGPVVQAPTARPDILAARAEALCHLTYGPAVRDAAWKHAGPLGKDGFRRAVVQLLAGFAPEEVDLLTRFRSDAVRELVLGWRVEDGTANPVMETRAGELADLAMGVPHALQQGARRTLFYQLVADLHSGRESPEEIYRLLGRRWPDADAASAISRMVERWRREDSSQLAAAPDLTLEERFALHLEGKGGDTAAFLASLSEEERERYADASAILREMEAQKPDAGAGEGEDTAPAGEV